MIFTATLVTQSSERSLTSLLVKHTLHCSSPLTVVKAKITEIQYSTVSSQDLHLR